MKKLFGTDGIRGIAGQSPLDPATVHAIGLAIARSLQGNSASTPKVLLGQDTRESSDWIAATLTAGLDAGGASVENAGVITTPAIAFLTREHSFATGIVISASHNPWMDNGIKLFGPDGYKLPDATEIAIEAEIFRALEASPARSSAPASDFPPPVKESDRAEYVRFLLAAVPDLSLDNQTVVVDCANGAASSVAPQIFAGLGGSVVITHASPTGRNINDNCGALYPQIVAAEVLQQHASLGITFDGDADRCLLADEHGRVVNGDAVLLLAARDLQARGLLTGNLVVATTMSNMGLEAALKRTGISMLRAPVGDKYVLEEMQRTGAALGGEQSGHIIFSGRSTTGDGLLTALLVLDILRRAGKPLTELLADLKVFPQVIVNVKVRERKPLDTILPVAEAIRAAETELADSGRVVIRYSGTETLARVMIEAESELAMRIHAEKIADAIRNEIGAMTSKEKAGISAGPLFVTQKLPSDHMHDQQDDHNQQNQTDTASTVVSQPRTHTVTAKAKHQEQHQQNDQHLSLSLQRATATTCPSIGPSCSHFIGCKSLPLKHVSRQNSFFLGSAPENAVDDFFRDAHSLCPANAGFLPHPTPIR